MKLEALTVSIGYADFLAETIPYNLQHFDHWVIVTSPDDDETRELCRRYNLTCMTTKEVYRENDEFNKGRAIIKAIDRLSCEGWVLHLDADMALPQHTRIALDMAHLNKQNLYGVDRVMVKGWEQWQRMKHSSYLRGGQWDYHCRVNFPVGYEIGSRWANREYGYCPIGAFQLWYGKTDLYRGIHTKGYPHSHNDASRGDVQHCLAWDRRERELLPEIIAVHLESEANAKLGANWKGRTTKRFQAPNSPCL